MYAQSKCKTDRRAACLGKRLFELARLSESRLRTTVGKVKNVESLLSARKLQEEVDILQE